MTIQQFIEKAIEGGWNEGYIVYECHPEVVALRKRQTPMPRTLEEIANLELVLDPHQIFLDPEAWKAVGKVEEWEQEPVRGEEVQYKGGWHLQMVRMIDAVAGGKTIEQYLETL